MAKRIASQSVIACGSLECVALKIIAVLLSSLINCHLAICIIVAVTYQLVLIIVFVGYRRFRQPLPFVARRSLFVAGRSSLVACDLESPLCVPYLL